MPARPDHGSVLRTGDPLTRSTTGCPSEDDIRCAYARSVAERIGAEFLARLNRFTQAAVPPEDVARVQA